MNMVELENILLGAVRNDGVIGHTNGGEIAVALGLLAVAKQLERFVNQQEKKK